MMRLRLEGTASVDQAHRFRSICNCSWLYRRENKQDFAAEQGK